MIVLASLLLTGCGGSGDGGAAPEELEYNAYFPLASNLSWQYNHHSSQARISGSSVIRGTEVAHLQYDTGSYEYFHTTGTDIEHHGLFITYIAVSTPSGIQTFTGDVWLFSPVTIFSTGWDPGYTRSTQGVGDITINPTYGKHAITYDSNVTYYGTETVTVPAGSFEAHHLSYTFTLRATIQGIDFSIPLNTELWLAEGIGIIRRIESGITFELNEVAGMPVIIEFSAVEGAGEAPLPKPLTIGGSKVHGSQYSTTVVYDGSDTGWLDMEAHPVDGTLHIRPNTTDLGAGRHTATVTLISGTGESHEIEVRYRLDPPGVQLPEKLEFDLTDILDPTSLEQELIPTYNGRPVDLALQSSTAWLGIDDSTTNILAPEFVISIDSTALYSLSGLVRESITVRYDNGYEDIEVTIPVEIQLPPDGLKLAPVWFNTVSGQPSLPAGYQFSLFGSDLSEHGFSIAYIGATTGWLDVVYDDAWDAYSLSVNRNDLTPGHLLAVITFTSPQGATVDLEVHYTMEAPELLAPGSVQWNIDNFTQSSYLIKQIGLQHTGELLSWDVATDVAWLKASGISNSIIDGGLAKLEVVANQLSSLENGRHTATVTVTYQGMYVDPTDLQIPVTLDIDMAEFDHLLPYVLYDSQAENISAFGTGLGDAASSGIMLDGTPLNTFTVTDSDRIELDLPLLSAGEHIVYVQNDLGIVRGEGRIVVKQALSYPETIIGTPGRVESMVYDEEREAFFGVFWNMDYGSDFIFARIQYQSGSWVTTTIPVADPKAVESVPTGEHLLVTDGQCGVHKVDPKTLTITPVAIIPQNCYYDVWGMLYVFDDGQTLIADTNQWPTVWTYPDFQNFSLPYVHSPKHGRSLKRNRMFWAEGPSSSGPHELYVYDSSTDTTTRVNINGSDYFLEPLISMDADGSRLIHYGDVYDGNLEYIDTLAEPCTLLCNTQATPDGTMAVKYQFGTDAISVFDISGSSGPFMKIGTDKTMPSGTINQAHEIMIPLDASQAIIFGHRQGFNIDPTFKMIIRDLP